MSNFLRALERTAKTEQEFGHERQKRFSAAERRAKAFDDTLRADLSDLHGYGVEASLKERTVSFKRGNLELLAVTFGTNDGSQNRIFSPVIEYLKLTPSYQDLPADEPVEEAAGVWLGRSLEAFDKNRSMFTALGLG